MSGQGTANAMQESSEEKRIAQPQNIDQVANGEQQQVRRDDTQRDIYQDRIDDIEDLATAEQELNNDKARREETDERSARGERPGGPVVGRGQDRGPGEAETDGQATAQDRAERSDSEQQNIATDEFVKAPDGSLDFGDIAGQVASVIGWQPGKIKLQKGEHRGNHLGFGLAHIEIEHPEIQDAVEFVSGVASSYDSIYKSPRGRLRIVKAGSPDELLVVELRPHKAGDFYSVVSAYKSRKVEGDLLWGAALSLPSGPGGQSALSETENLRETGETRPSAKQTAHESIAQPQNIDQAANGEQQQVRRDDTQRDIYQDRIDDIEDLATAEQELNNDKARREESGERAARGERPGGPVVGRGQDRGPGEAETDGPATAQDRQGEGAERSDTKQQNIATDEFVKAPDGSPAFGECPRREKMM